jgi:hypothetical protein
MLPLFVGCLLLAVVPLGFGFRRHLFPFILGLTASALILIGKFVLAATGVTIAGIAILVGAHLWSYRARRLANASASCAGCAGESRGPSATEGTAEIPIACSLDKAQLAKRVVLVAGLAAAAAERKPITNGFALRFRPKAGLVTELAHFVELERACCPFLTFRIDVGAGGAISLAVSGPVAAQDIIRELISSPQDIRHGQR